MSVTPQTLPRHEVIGLDVTVRAATDDAHVGVTGHVIRETMQTIVIRCEDTTDCRMVPKRGTTFAFRLPTETVVVSGDRLLARPAERSQTGGVSPWV